MSEIVKVVKNENYTVMSNKHLRDKSLSLKAKGLMSLVLSFPPDWNYTIKGLQNYAKDGRESFANTLKELEDNYYLNRKRERNSKGQVKDNHYTFYENPCSNPDFCAGSTKSDEKIVSIVKNKPESEKPFQAASTKSCKEIPSDFVEGVQNSPIPRKPVQGKPAQGNPSQLNTNILNTNILNTYISSSSNKAISKTTMMKNDDELKNNLRYYDLVCQFSEKQVDEIFFILSDIFSLNSGSVRINGRSVRIAELKTELSQLSYEHIRYILDCLSDKKDIKNRRAYILTALFNGKTSYEVFGQINEEAHETSYDINEFEQYALRLGVT